MNITNIISELLGFIHNSKNVEKRPLYYSYTVGITSLWLLCPLLTFMKNNTITLPWLFFIICTVVCSIMSTIMWKEFQNNNTTESVRFRKNLMYTLDIYTARAYFLVLIVMNLVLKPISIYVTLFFIIIVFLMFHITCFLNDNDYHKLSVYTHLLFRYFGWWWVWISFGNYSGFGVGLIFVNILYWLHILYSIYFVCPSVDLTCVKAYNIGCVELIIIILYIVILFL